MSGRLLIVGASGRAAAASALRAGFDPFVIDLFADADTKRLCPVLKCDPADYPHGFVPLAAQAPPGPWMYTGGLENHPEVVVAISETRELWGNGPDKLAAVRDPFAVRSHYQAVAYSIPECLSGTELPPTGRTWLRKPLRGSGGGGISRAYEADQPSDRHLYQVFIAGQPVSLLFVSEDRRLCSMPREVRRWPHTIDVCAFRQLIGTPWLHAPGPFAYCGNLGPLPVRQFGLPGFGASVLGDMNDIRARLAGIWGADFILTDDEAWLIEINPRCPASAELLAHSRLNPFDWLKGCFTEPDSLWKAKTWTTWPEVIGKGIYYAAAPLVFPASGPWDESLARCTDVWRRQDYADIPESGTAVAAGQPVLTLFADGATEADCLAGLKRRAAELDRLFGVEPSPENQQ